MPENPDGSSGQAESAQDESTCSTRTKSKGSLGAGGQKKLNRDQSQWITGSRRKWARPGPRPRDHGETDAGRTRPGRSPRGDRQGMQARPGPNPVDHWEHTGKRSKAGGDRGRTVGSQKTAYAPPVSKDAADGVQHPCRCVKGQTLRIKLHIVRP